MSLVRTAEMYEIQVPNLLEEAKSHGNIHVIRSYSCVLGMIARHYPIKDKWIPPSMEGLIDNVEWIIARLKEGPCPI